MKQAQAVEQLDETNMSFWEIAVSGANNFPFRPL
jgi:hypothetical protein